MYNMFVNWVDLLSSLNFSCWKKEDELWKPDGSYLFVDLPAMELMQDTVSVKTKKV